MAGGAVEQLQAELAFQPPDLLADGGLDDVQPFGGPPEVQLLGNRQKVPDLSQLHPDHPSFITNLDESTNKVRLGRTRPLR
ncbi:hypothetical protein HEK616_79360 (plasmid) [Streptomyces nigrescens]|uniref:Uncharacterized protein n=1 Tax=Streptomyces nigrescens TaxID=1920 RepID=A0ABN6RCT7_STRNI|nr:hypothetical protein HEK616_79360 [Streptomyces nigrescens]